MQIIIIFFASSAHNFRRTFLIFSNWLQPSVLTHSQRQHRFRRQFCILSPDFSLLKHVRSINCNCPERKSFSFAVERWNPQTIASCHSQLRCNLNLIMTTQQQRGKNVTDNRTGISFGDVCVVPEADPIHWFAIGTILGSAGGKPSRMSRNLVEYNVNLWISEWTRSRGSTTLLHFNYVSFKLLRRLLEIIIEVLSIPVGISAQLYAA